MDESHHLIQPVLATASFWGAVLGALLAVPRATRPVGAGVLMLIGYGGVGVAWERTTGCDLRMLHRPPRVAISGVITHLPLAIAGHALLWSVANGRKS